MMWSSGPCKKASPKEIGCSGGRTERNGRGSVIGMPDRSGEVWEGALCRRCRPLGESPEEVIPEAPAAPFRSITRCCINGDPIG
mmetsp:Transcript_23092/g.50745  ORF Transcript_23092/g.50745 Transcript_23092/m.50745 type:complete len:84 (+) Transcript_23092:401-652(+)